MAYTVLVMYQMDGNWRTALYSGYEDKTLAVLAAEEQHDEPEALDISRYEMATVLSAVFDEEARHMVYVETQTRVYWPDPPPRQEDTDDADDSERMCCVCSGPFDLQTEGGVAGDIGILEVALCPKCYTGVYEMVEGHVLATLEAATDADD